jgi:thioredoxin 1
MINIADKNEFEREISSGVVIVDFYAQWCGPCKLLGPILEELSEEMAGKVKFIKVDVDKNMAIARQYGVVNIPTMVILKDGNKQDMLAGFLPKLLIKENIQKYL